jgi:Lrp/AsnC family transcriptional regulator for asnA, asnC and gidA
MEKIDFKDRKILYELDLDSRQSFRSIGRKVGLTKDVVASRVKKLQEKEVITGYYTRFDYSKLGVTPLRFYFKYQYITPEVKKEIIDHFVNFKNTSVVFSLDGSYDIMVLILIKNVIDVFPFWQKTLDKFGDYFSDRVFSVYASETIYGDNFLVDEKQERTKIILSRDTEKLDIDKLDFQILKRLASNSRIPTIEIAKDLNATANIVGYRIKKLLKSGLIIGFKTMINWAKIGYQWFKVDLYLSEYTQTHKIIKYVETNPNFYTVDHTIGYADLELEWILKDLNHLDQIIEDLHSKFPRVIRNYKYFHVKKPHKYLELDFDKI